MSRIEQIVQLVENGDVERALALIPKAKAEASDEEKYMLADQLFSWGMLDEACAIVEELSLRYPDEGDVLLFLAEIYIELDERRKSAGNFNGHSRRRPTFSAGMPARSGSLPNARAR